MDLFLPHSSVSGLIVLSLCRLFLLLLLLRHLKHLLLLALSIHSDGISSSQQVVHLYQVPIYFFSAPDAAQSG